jgi:hypothetical protein
MNRIVVRQVTGSTLPAEVLGDIDPSHRVEVTVRDLEPPSQDNALVSLTGLAKGVYGTADAILQHVDDLRRDREP